jgi:hypothetical protein
MSCPAYWDQQQGQLSQPEKFIDCTEHSMPLRASSYMLTLCNLMVPDIKSDKGSSGKENEGIFSVGFF